MKRYSKEEQRNRLANIALGFTAEYPRLIDALKRIDTKEAREAADFLTELDWTAK